MSPLHRRDFVRLNAAALAGATLTPHLARGRAPEAGTEGSAPENQNPSPGFYRFTLGDVEITVLSDGYFHFPFDLLAEPRDPYDFLAMDAGAGERREYFQSRLVPSDHIPLAANPVLVDTGRTRVLVDTGFGEEGPPTGGRVLASLESAGVPPESIDTVLLTHAHPDHLGGLFEAGGGPPTFPNAEVVVSEGEWEFWTGAHAVEALEQVMAEPEEFQEGMGGPLVALGDRLRTIRADEEVVGGIRSIPSPGHTPGHISIGVDTGERPMLLTGDAIVFTHSSFEHPEWELLTDLDRREAGRTRRRLLDRAATDEMLILGFHFPFPGLGYALRFGDAYRWHPAGWTVLG